MPSHLITPYGGELVQLMAPDDEQAELKAAATGWPSWDLTPRQMYDLELLMCGGFSPLAGFMARADYDGVVEKMRLADGTFWPLPMTLDISEAVADGLEPGKSTLALRDLEGVMLAALEVQEVWRPDHEHEAEAVFGTTDREHPGVDYLLGQTNPCYVAGRLRGVQPPRHFDFRLLRHTPAELRYEFNRRGWRRVMAFQTRNPIHRPQVAMTLRAAGEHQTNLLLHPVVGQTQPGDVDHYTRVRCYQAILDRFPRATTTLSLLPLSMRMAGPREALLHCIIRRNYGCTHMVVGPDQSGPRPRMGGEAYYPRFAAQELCRDHQDELGIKVVGVKELVFVSELKELVASDEVPNGLTGVRFSGTDFRRRLSEGKPPPEWYAFDEVLAELARSYPPRHRQGFSLFFTGLSGSGKSTVANVVMVRLLEMGGRPVTLLDGDIVRKHLSSELNFSKEHRDINIRRIGFVASEISKNGGIAICAPIAPYHQMRKEVRQMISEGGGFILVHVSTPLDVCEQRDRKGMYAKARAGLIKGFTGIDDPYEVPVDADLDLDTSDLSPTEAANRVVLFLEKEGYIAARR